MNESTASYEQHIESARLAHGRADSAGTEQALRSAIRAAESLADGHLKLVAALIRLGDLKHGEGLSDEAEVLFRRALDIGERILGQDDLALVPPLTSLGALRIARGKPEDAEPLLTRALAISEKSLGRDHPDLVVLLNDLSRHYLKQSAYAFAEPLLLQLYSIKRSKGEDHPEVATVLASLAAVRQALGRHDAAEQLWRRVLEIRERTLAPNHFAIATAIEHLAETCAARGKLGEALQLFQRALAMRELTLGAAHPSLRVSRERIADLQLQGSEESFDLGSASPLLKLAEWALPAAPEAPATRGAAQPEPRPVTTPPVVPAPAFTPAPVPQAPSRVELMPVAESPATVAVRAPALRPAFTPDSDARPAIVRSPEPRPEIAPEAYADDDEPSALRLFAVGPEGHAGSALVMPSFSGDLAAIEDELAQQADDARLGNRTRAATASAAAFVRERPVPVLAVGLGAVALAVFAVGGGSFGSSDLGRPVADAPQQTLPVTVPIQDSTPVLAVSSGTLDGPEIDRPAGEGPTERPKSTSSSDEPSERRATKTAAPERSTGSSAPAPVTVPDFGRPIGGVATAQLDAAMRAAGGSAAPVGNGLTRPSVTFSTGLLEQPGAALATTKESQPQLIGAMPRIAYPASLLAKGREVQGQVLVEFSVDTLGRPDMSTLSVLQSDHELFTAAVRKAIPSMRFVPAIENGRKTRALVNKQFRFALDR